MEAGTEARPGASREEVRLLGWLNVGFAALNLGLGLVLLILIAIARSLGNASPPRGLEWTTWIVNLAPGLGALLVATALPGLAAGIGLLRKRRWARGLTLVAAALQLPQLPAGTVLAAFGLWVLFKGEPPQPAPKREVSRGDDS